MTIKELYRDYCGEKISKRKFLNECLRNSSVNGFISPMNSFQDVVKILKNKGIISECECENQGQPISEYVTEDNPYKDGSYPYAVIIKVIINADNDEDAVQKGEDLCNSIYSTDDLKATVIKTIGGNK